MESQPMLVLESLVLVNVSILSIMSQENAILK